MPPSRRTDVQTLVDELASADAIARESAAARLVVAGERAVTAVRALVADESRAPAARIAGLQALWDLHRHQAIEAASHVVAGGDDGLALDAIDLLGQALVDASDVSGGDRALEHLTRFVLDDRIAPIRRRAMLERLRPLPLRLREPVFDALATDGVLAADAAASRSSLTPVSALERWSDEERLPATPDHVVDAIAHDGDRVAITTLARLIPLLRAREKQSSGPERETWRQPVGLLHEALARRGSLLALYDLRETLEDAGQHASAPLLAAAMAIGDTSCLDGIATRWIHAGHDVWLRDQLERIVHAIVTRERLHRRSPAIVRLLKRHPAAAPLVATASRHARS